MIVPDPEGKLPWRWLLPLARRIDRLLHLGRQPAPTFDTPDLDRPLHAYPLRVRRLDDGEALEPGERLVVAIDPATENAELVACAVPDGQAPPDRVEIDLKPAPRPVVHWAPIGHRFTDCCGRLVAGITPPDECHTGPTAGTCNGGREPW